MQQDKNDIENKLRQLENQQLPDLSQMDGHWQAMNQMLAPGAAVSKPAGNFLKVSRKVLLFAASVTAIIIFILVYQNKVADKEKQTKEAVVIESNASPEKKTEGTTALTDTLEKPAGNKRKLTPDPVYADVNMDRYFKQGDSATVAEGNGDSADFFVDGNDKPASAQVVKTTLNNFYEQIQKQAQEFIMNADKGGIIKCSEGTAFIIPPVAFADENNNNITGEVKVVIVEYYKYSDMIAANLTTMSDGKQLITGGMVRITVESKGRPVKLRSDKFIDIKMPTKNFDAAMQLFESATGTNKVRTGYTMVTLAGSNEFTSARYRNINWQLNSLQSSIPMPVFDGTTNFLDMGDAPYVVRYGRKTVGKFTIPSNSALTVDEAKKILTEKYGYSYDKIKVKKSGKRQTRNNEEIWDNMQVGDSMRLTLDQAIRWHYIDRKDSAFYAAKIRNDSINFYKKYYARFILGDSLVLKRKLFNQAEYAFEPRTAVLLNQDSINKYYELYLRTQQAYSFRIQNLGWINCDRFSNYQDKSDFIINLPAGVNGQDFVSQLAFINIRSVMGGKTYENKIGFANVPVNMPVYLVGLGEKDGKVVSFIEKLKTGQKEVDVTNFEETTAEAFKNKLAVLDLQ